VIAFRAGIFLSILNYGFRSFAATFSALNLVLAPWTADCQNPQASAALICGLPKAAGSPVKFAAIPLSPAERPGQVGVVSQAFNASGLRGLMTIYSVMPVTGDPHPPYLQMRIELIAPVRALCMNSAAWHPGDEIVPLICVGIAGTQQWGLTVTGRMLGTSNFSP